MNVLVTGGAGYIGSVISKLLLDANYRVSVLDNFEAGHRSAVPEEAELIEVDLRDISSLSDALSGRKFNAVFHMASSIVVSESEKDPLNYYQNNVTSSLNLLQALSVNKDSELPSHFVLSSTAAVYADDASGFGLDAKLTESSKIGPKSCYGMTKLVCEDIFERFSSLNNVRLVVFRYFNTAGAWQGLGERHDPETHLIPRLITAGISGIKAQIYGTDYPTPDGTPIRDYVHVRDIAAAHVSALSYKGDEKFFNLGAQKGYSVLEVVKEVENQIGKKLELDIQPRRAGDVPFLVASAERAEKELGWASRQSELSEIVHSAVEFASCG